MRGVVAWFAGNHVASNLLMIFFLIAGAVIGTTIKVEVFPESTLDYITIKSEYPGASPSEVEEGIIRQVEENVAGLAGIKRIDSTAREGYGVVTIEIMKGWDSKNLLDEIKAEVDRIVTFPQEAEKPVVQEIVPRSRVINVAIYGDVPESTLKYLAEKLKDDITDLPGITLAGLFGVRTGEIHIEIAEETLRRYGLTLGHVADLIRRASLDMPAGSIKTQGGDILIRTKGRKYFAKDYQDIGVITRPDGTNVTLKEIAHISDGFQDIDLFTRFQGKPAAIIQVYRVGSQNAIKVSTAVKQYIEEIRPTIPAGVEISCYRDLSKVLRGRLGLLIKNMTLGLLLVITLLSLFLNLRLAFWVTLGIPISFMFGLMFLPSLDVSINLLSLFAFILVLGIVVDDAIVIGENIFRKQEEGLAPLEASIEGALEVGRPVTFSVLTTIAAFWPLLLGSGMMGNFMRTLPLVVIMVLFGSLIESLLILPSHLAGHKADKSSEGDPNSVKKNKSYMSRWLKYVITGPYNQLINFCVKWRYATVGFAISLLLLISGTWSGGWIKYNFMPEIEGDHLSCTLTMPVGTPVQQTRELVEYLEKSAQKALTAKDKTRPQGAPSLFKKSISYVGCHLAGHGPVDLPPEMGGHLAQVFIQILDGEKRNISANELSRIWREGAGPIPEAKSITFQSELFSAGSAIEIHLSHHDDEILIAAVNEFKTKLKTYPGVFDIDDSYLPGKKELQLQLKPAARTLGLTLNDLAYQVRHAFYGAEVLRLQRDQDEVKVLVRYPEAERKSLGNIEEMRIRISDGTEVPFRQIALVKMEQSYASIQRAQRRRVIKVMADVDETVSNANELRQNVISKVLPQLKLNYPGLRHTIEGEGKEQKESMVDVQKGFFIALFLIYALLAIPFRSFSQPLIVMMAIPFGIIGAISGHLIMGFNLSVFSIFGIVGLTGVVVNDSLVLIHATNRIRRQGVKAHEAVIQAGMLRFRAIILTSLTTFAGLTPIIFETSVQAQFLIPMALSLGFGVLFATFITLLLIPCNYMILNDLQKLAGNIKSRKLR